MIPGVFVDGVGGISPLADFAATDFIPVEFDDNTPITIRGCFFYDAGAAFYDENQNVVLIINGRNYANYGLQSEEYPNLQELSIIPPANTKYVRLTAHLLGDYKQPSDLWVKGYHLKGELQEQAAYLTGVVNALKPEVENARIGYNGKRYNSVGDAIREQVKPLNNKINSFAPMDIASQTSKTINVEVADNTELEVSSNKSESTILYYCGKNLLPNAPWPVGESRGITHTSQPDGSIKFSGTASETRFLDIILGDKPFYLAPGTYTLSLRGAENSPISMVLASGNSVLAQANSGGNISQQFTLTSGLDVYCYIFVGAGVAVDVAVYPQLEVGALSAYEPYHLQEIEAIFPDVIYLDAGKHSLWAENGSTLTAVKRTIIPVEEVIEEYVNAATEYKADKPIEDVNQSSTLVSINTVNRIPLNIAGSTSGNVDLIHCGKNLLPTILWAQGEVNGMKHSLTDKGGIRLIGTPLDYPQCYDIATKTEPLHLAAGTYTLSIRGETQKHIQVLMSNATSDMLVAYADSIDIYTTFTLKHAVDVCVWVKIEVGVSVDTTVYCQLERGDELTDYEPYNKKIINTSLPCVVKSCEGINNFCVNKDTVLTLTAQIPMTVEDYVESQIESALDARLANIHGFNPSAYNLPILYLDGDTTLMTKDDAVDLTYRYGDRTGTASVKWQGSSSIAYPKKNYTVKFDNTFEAVEGWGSRKKYCMKANYIDFTHSRNVVSAKLWGQIVASRTPANTTLAACPNYGAVDGFPICIVMNGEYYGVYTFNIPKDAWMMNMGGGSKECILCADAHSESNKFKAEATLDGDFDVEYITDENNIDWARNSLNNLINACINSDGTDLDTVIAPMLDWESAIDYYIFVALLRGEDMITKNYLINTYDGTKWFFGAYDLDSTYGLHWDGKSFIGATDGFTIKSMASSHKVFQLIRTYKRAELKERYWELRNGVMSEDNVAKMFRNFAGQISRPLLDEDNRLWPGIPNTNANNVNQILDWYRLRVATLDKEVENM